MTELMNAYDISTILGVLLFLSATVSALTKLFSSIWDKLMRLYRFKKGIEDKDSLIKDTLEQHNKEIEVLNRFETETHNDVKAIKSMLENHIIKDNERTVSSFRSTLYRLHMEFTGQNYVTPEGLKTFKEIGKVYEEAGGDDIFHDKLEPEVVALPIKYSHSSVI